MIYKIDKLDGVEFTYSHPKVERLVCCCSEMGHDCTHVQKLVQGNLAIFQGVLYIERLQDCLDYFLVLALEDVAIRQENF